MKFLEYLKIGDNWILSGVIYAFALAAVVLAIRNGARISRFVSEVKGELRKANWPWESDPKIKGFKKYKELVDSTIVVLIATVLLAGFVTLWDTICTTGLNFITKLGGA
jgi:preprotein translocase subunit SecE